MLNHKKQMLSAAPTSPKDQSQKDAQPVGKVQTANHQTLPTGKQTTTNPTLNTYAINQDSSETGEAIRNKQLTLDLGLGTMPDQNDSRGH